MTCLSGLSGPKWVILLQTPMKPCLLKIELGSETYKLVSLLRPNGLKLVFRPKAKGTS